MEFKALLREALDKQGFEYTETQLEQTAVFNDVLLRVNEQMNLTAITDPEQMVYKHYIDSLSGLKAGIPENAKVLDVGCGAGFPSVPIMIFRPDLKLTLLDALQKRLNFIDGALKEADILPCELLHERAEIAGRNKKYREQYDIVLSRAVANLSVLLEFCTPFLKVGGKLIAYKGPAGQQELDEAEGALRLLGCSVQEELHFTVGDGERVLLIIQKDSPTPARFPRKFKAIQERKL